MHRQKDKNGAKLVITAQSDNGTPMINKADSARVKMKKISFIDGNRAINKNNVKKHVESFKKFNRNLVPLLYVEAVDVDGHTLYDADTEEVVEPEDYKDYWVVLDGQHRYKAAKQLADSEDANGFTLDNLKWQKVELGENTFEDVLIEVNSRTQPWKGADYICGCILQNPENEAVKFAKELTDEGVSSKTVNKYLFFNDKFKWADAVSDVKKLDGADVERAKTIWEVVKKFPLKMRIRSIIIDFIKENGGTEHWLDELARVEALTDEQIQSFEKEKVNELKNAFDKMMEAQKVKKAA